MLHFARRLRYFSESDVALLAMLEPAIRRLVRRSSTEAPGASLTPSERQVLALVAQGCSNREIAEDLYVTVHTVRKHLEHAYRKLGVQNRTAAGPSVQFPALSPSLVGAPSWVRQWRLGA
jgi:DNA-binding CsgD family transcriptional regulator